MIFLKAPRDDPKCLTTLPYKVLAKFSWTKTPQQRVLHIPVRLLCFGNEGWDLFSYPFCFMMAVGLVGEIGEYTHTTGMEGRCLFLEEASANREEEEKREENHFTGPLYDPSSFTFSLFPRLFSTFCRSRRRQTPHLFPLFRKVK